MPKVKTVHKNIILAILAVAQFMVVLDVSIVNVALPSIERALHFAGASALQWVVTAYTLAFGGFLLLGGRTADLYGRKRVFMIGVGAFALGSLLTGLAQTSTMMIVSRGLQGLAGAFMSPAALSLVLTTFREGKERNKALSVWGAVAAGGAAAGVLLGGLLTEYLNWRWNFFVNVPVAIAVVIAALYLIPESKADLDHSQLDLPGALLVTSGLMLLVYGLTKAPGFGWTSSRTIVYLAGAAILLISFVLNERKTDHPLVPFSIFKIGNVAAANLTQLPITAGLFSMFFFVTLYVQLILGYTPLKSGLGFLPVTVVVGITASLMSKVIGKIGYKIPLLLGPAFMSGGLFYLSHIRVNGTYLHDVLPGLIFMAMGLGMEFVSLTIAATNGVPPRESGLASGLLNTSQQVGGSLGLAILSGITASAAATYIVHHATQANVIAQAQVAGYQHSFRAGIVFTVIAFLVTLIFIKQPKGEAVNPESAAIAAG